MYIAHYLSHIEGAVRNSTLGAFSIVFIKSSRRQACDTRLRELIVQSCIVTAGLLTTLFLNLNEFYYNFSWQ